MDDPQRQEDDLETISFQELFRFIRRGLVPALLVGVAAAVGAYVLSSQQDPVYEAGATVLMSRNEGEMQSFGVSLVTAPTLDPAAYRAAAFSDQRLRAVLEATGIDAPTPGTIAVGRLEALDTRLRDRDDIARTSGLPVLAEFRARAHHRLHVHRCAPARSWPPTATAKRNRPPERTSVRRVPNAMRVIA